MGKTKKKKQQEKIFNWKHGAPNSSSGSSSIKNKAMANFSDHKKSLAKHSLLLSSPKIKVETVNHPPPPPAEPEPSGPIELLRAEEMKLPIYEAKSRLIHHVTQEDVFIILGETGSGKTTQIPKYIYEAKVNNVGRKIPLKKKLGIKYIKKRMIAITQPRRVAAISVAKRIATEMNVEVGDLVGYSVRFDNKTSNKTVIKYMTDGMLLRESIQDPNFTKYSFIIIDEAHERTINTDLLLGLVKKAQEKRSKFKNKSKHLKLIIMSATLDTERFEQYFPNAKICYLQGRQHEVTLFHATKPTEDYCYATTSAILNLHQSLPIDHHILAFLTGQDEIDSVVQYLNKLDFPTERPLKAYPLSASVSYEAQLRAITPALDGMRKVVVSTNIAETSLTIPGIRVVIDCGYVKAKFHISCGIGLDVMKIIPISQSQVWQRSGRAGREFNGTCYRLYTQSEFNAMEKFQEPEIRRANLAGVLLYLYKLGIDRPESFDWIDTPSEMCFTESLDELVKLGAIDASTEPHQLTVLGSQMAEAPLSPAFSKILIISGGLKYSVQEPITTILSMLATESIFLTCDDEIRERRKIFNSPYGDLIMYLNVFRRFCKSNKKMEWCNHHKINFRAIKFVLDVRKQLLEFCQLLELKTQHAPKELINENIIKCFISCLPQNLAFHESGNKYHINKSNHETISATIHPSSCLHNRNHSIVSFTELVQIPSGNNYIKNVSFVDSPWIV